MSHRTKSSAAKRIVEVDREAERQKQLDEMVREAARGCRRAIGVIAIAFTTALNDEAKEALGPKWEEDSGDVVQELFVGIRSTSRVPDVRRELS